MSRNLQVTRRLALIDWDGTIRKDFTIRAWVKFLVKHKILPEQAIEDTEEVFTLLHNGSISHDEAAHRIAVLYASYLRGYREAEITKMISLFFKEDVQHLCSFSTTLFSYLARNNIQIIIVSGAPKVILQEYQRIFPIESIQALELQTLQGVFTGKVFANHGTSQEKYLLIDRILKSQACEVVFAAGNSSSDLPLLEAAPTCIIVNNTDLKPGAKSLHLHCDDTNIGRILNFLEKEIGYGF